MNPSELFKKSIVCAIKAPGNVITGLGAVLLSVVTTNPLPLIFFTVGSGFWIKYAVGNHRYDEELMAGENQIVQSQEQNAQAHLEEEVRSLFGRDVVRQFINQGLLPDYLRAYRELVIIRDEAAQIARQRRDVANTIEDEIIAKLDQMLAGYLRLSRARVMYAHVLFGIYGNTRSSSQEEENTYYEKPRDEEKPSRRRTVFFEEERRPRSKPRTTDHDTEFFSYELKSYEDRVAELGRKIEELKAEAMEKPNVAQVCESHIGLLQKQIELLRRSKEQDQRVEAQLEALPAAFSYILDSVRASQFTADQVTSYMTGVIQEVDDTIRFVEAVQLDDNFPGIGLPQLHVHRQQQTGL